MDKEQKLKKGIICIHCENYFECKGSVNPDMCVNYKLRYGDNSGKVDKE